MLSAILLHRPPSKRNNTVSSGTTIKLNVFEQNIRTRKIKKKKKKKIFDPTLHSLGYASVSIAITNNNRRDYEIERRKIRLKLCNLTVP
jgi:hypothetical protein